MNKATKILGAWGIALILSGCPIWIDTDQVDPWGCPDCDYYTCVTDAECPGAHYCHAGYCERSFSCAGPGTCPSGYTCNEWNTCVPAEHLPCRDNSHCLNGYCNQPDADHLGWCITTGHCADEADCVAYGQGLTCDERNLCVPDEGPCPSGQCGCSADRDCARGSLCINSRCTSTTAVCIFDFECGDGVCLDNTCHQVCQGEGECPTGQRCDDGRCLDKPEGAGNCVFHEDCGDPALQCLNATCHPVCDSDETCGAGEACLGGVCQADPRPQRQCLETSDCEAGKDCIRGLCRMPCLSDLNCSAEQGMTVCLDQVCSFPAERDAVCERAAHCAEAGASCLDGQCVTLAL